MTKSKPDHKRDTPKFSSFKPKGKRQLNDATTSDAGRRANQRPAEVKLGNHRVSKPNDSDAKTSTKPKHSVDGARAERALNHLQNDDSNARQGLNREVPIRPSNRSSIPGHDRRNSGESRRRRPGFDYRENNRMSDRKAIRRMDDSRGPENNTPSEPDLSKVPNSDLFTIDLSGDKNNLTFGINKWEVPLYRLAGGGSIIGLDPSIKIDFAQSTDRYYLLKYPPGPSVGIHKVATPAARVAMPDVEDEGPPALLDQAGEHESEGELQDDYVDMEMEEFQDPGMDMVTAK